MQTESNRSPFSPSFVNTEYPSVIETLAAVILRSASARLVRIEPATKDKPTLVFFRFAWGDAQEHVLPITELCENNVRRAWQKGGEE